MKHILLPLILLIASCVTVASPPVEVELTGLILGSYVSTSSGMYKGDILHVSEATSIQKVSAVADGNPGQILLIHKNPESLSDFAGKQVKVVGEINAEHRDIFHTDFVLNITEIAVQ